MSRSVFNIKWKFAFEVIFAFDSSSIRVVPSSSIDLLDVIEMRALQMMTPHEKPYVISVPTLRDEIQKLCLRYYSVAELGEATIFTWVGIRIKL